MSKCLPKPRKKFPRTLLNLAGGPSNLPDSVLKDIQNEILHYDSNGRTILELHHQTDVYNNLQNYIKSLVKELLKINDNYEVFFTHGGGQGLFSIVPLNLIGRTGTADFVVTGIWSERAAKEAAKFGNVHYVLPKPSSYKDVPPQTMWKLNPRASYVHICDNETINGIEFPFLPETGNVPLVADMGSSIMTKPIDVSKYGLIFASAQKVIGTAGVGLVIVRKDLIGHHLPFCPLIWEFTLLQESNSRPNTPPIFAIYVLGKVLQWTKDNGGVEVMDKLAKTKSKILYDVIDNSCGFYACPMVRSVRSRINVTFRLEGGNETLENIFLESAECAGIYNIAGHRWAGGIRVSLFNAITVANAQYVADFMWAFYKICTQMKRKYQIKSISKVQELYSSFPF